MKKITALVLKEFSVLSLIVLLPVFLGACASRNIHSNDQSNPEVLRRQWVYPVPPLSSQYGKKMEYSPPRLDGNTLAFGSTKTGVMAIYPKLLAKRWEIKIENGAFSPIERANDQYYFVGGDGNVYSVNAETGKQNWVYPLRNPIASKPRIASGKVFLTTSDDTVVALDEKSGQWLWHYRRRNLSGPTIHGSATPYANGEELWTSFADGALVALSQKDGKVLWEKQLNNFKKFTDVDADPVRDGDVLFWPAYDGSLYALNPHDGKTLWVVDDIGGAQGVTLMGDTLLISGSNGYVTALSKKNGKIEWKFEMDRGVPGKVAVIGKTLIVPSTGEFLYALSREGKLLSRMSVGYNSGFVGEVAIDQERPWFYAMSRGGNLMAFSVEREN